MLARELFSREVNAELGTLLRKLVGYAALDEKDFRLLTGVNSERATRLIDQFPDVDLSEYEVRSFVWCGLGALMAFYPTRTDVQLDPSRLSDMLEVVRAGLGKRNPEWAMDGGL